MNLKTYESLVKQNLKHNKSFIYVLHKSKHSQYQSIRNMYVQCRKNLVCRVYRSHTILQGPQKEIIIRPHRHPRF